MNVPALQVSLLSTIRECVAVLVAEASQPETIKLGDQAFRRYTLTVQRALKGHVSGEVTMLIAVAGKFTPTAPVGRPAVYLLADAGDGDALVLAPRTSPIPLPEGDDAEALVSHLDIYVELSLPETPDPARVRTHALNMLETPFALTQVDGSRLIANDAEAWQPGQLARVRARLDPGEGEAPLPAEARENVVLVLLRALPEEAAVEVARGELRADNADAVYYGLDERPSGADAILRALVFDDALRLKLDAIRIAGLLRQRELVEELAQQLEEAVTEAKKLVDRD